MGVVVNYPPPTNVIVNEVTGAVTVVAAGPRGVQGVPGVAATVAVGTTSTGAPGSSASVTNSGSSSAAVFDFAIPEGVQGEQGIQGIPGNAATVAAGTTTTGAAGSSASVTNSGTSSAAVFDFTIPQGIQGEQGIQGIQGIQGVQGEPGVVTATSPATYDAPTQTVGVDQTAITLAQSQVTGLATDLAARSLLTQLPHIVVVPGFIQPTATNAVMTQGYLAGTIYNAACLNGSNAIDNFYEWGIECAAGTYTLRVMYRIATGNGIATISVDGVALATTIDMYGVTANNNITDITGIALTAGRHTIRYTASGKNALSSGFLVYLHGWSLTRTGA